MSPKVNVFVFASIIEKNRRKNDEDEGNGIMNIKNARSEFVRDSRGLCVRTNSVRRNRRISQLPDLLNNRRRRGEKKLLLQRSSTQPTEHPKRSFPFIPRKLKLLLISSKERTGADQRQTRSIRNDDVIERESCTITQ